MSAILLVSHSRDIAEGTRQLLKQMAGDVDVYAVGGVEDGKEIGTSFDAIQERINQINEDLMCFYDLGSAEMNLDMALEMYEGNCERVKVEAPIVEGSFTAAVKLSTGASLNDALEEVKKHYAFK
ncbi:dihydroxyacetone kinase phosphoryl donor subunit DhaM [Staphylococcus pettenkoferi]|mgnify:CR=1 FL=1|uniref:phosphoenolpyruvate--glycerone phosphotransferase n=1 Tax=Staphylococcus pettenkoferi TaxID=170573 RepID=A0ABT4BLD5_9STAP|nr:dihydroxyacetone kinase phosphoryl donor subunit DhaM [Staphylococcus pettenkoferi]MCI2803191.1 PTS-dependent dihydroxyacetone kinase phosphotransferase subunit DhaM [Staphylococcus pettenkoferi]MCY1564525.1 dihydroxyacetone kinase phosphoryl donor subunit DhaM [Staphylococcus pettenkoferi]MCY1572265.1 dihydroxyacetone kinase phosphoryl donor subunit DhaM [Staphylococcus pettenkoferi]MCY1583481.1 dihydroxyacetone kinase phosphoryl donor subunit DhaM [Staphylococcus pettenkoferi]MCY1589169.1